MWGTSLLIHKSLFLIHMRKPNKHLKYIYATTSTQAIAGAVYCQKNSRWLEIQSQGEWIWDQKWATDMSDKAI